MSFWLLETSVGEMEREELSRAITDSGAQFKNVRRRPFTNEVQGLPHKYKELPTMVYGSVAFVTWAKKKNLPGVWVNNNFNFEVQRNVYGHLMLNYESEIHMFGNIPKYEGERFIRPVDDGKAFTGEIISYDKLHAWQDRLEYFNGSQVSPKTLVQVSPVKSIFREYRFFVVNKKVVTGSLYNEDNKLIRRPLKEEDIPVVQFAQNMIDHWSPDTVSVIDIAVLNDSHEFKIIEFNNANASGFYESDKRAFVDAINEIL